MNPEQLRLQEARNANASWTEWVPYLSERQWGTVREDCSEIGMRTTNQTAERT